MRRARTGSSATSDGRARCCCWPSRRTGRSTRWSERSSPERSVPMLSAIAEEQAVGRARRIRSVDRPRRSPIASQLLRPYDKTPSAELVEIYGATSLAPGDASPHESASSTRTGSARADPRRSSFGRDPGGRRLAAAPGRGRRSRRARSQRDAGVLNKSEQTAESSRMAPLTGDPGYMDEGAIVSLSTART